MRYIMLVLLNIILFSAVPAHAEGDVAKAVVHEGVRAAFDEFEKQMIYKYFDEHPYQYTHENEYEHDYDHGKNKGRKKGLPPGIQKKLARGGTLPPGIAKQYLPNDLNRQLPSPPHGYERVIHGTDVLLVEINTGRIADIVADVITGD